MTTIVGTTTIAQMVIETTIGGEEFRGVTSSSGQPISEKTGPRLIMEKVGRGFSMFTPKYRIARDCCLKHIAQQPKQVKHESSCRHEMAGMEMGEMQILKSNWRATSPHKSHKWNSHSNRQARKWH